MKKSIFIMTVMLLCVFVTSLLLAEQTKKAQVKSNIQAPAKRYPVDVGVVYINTLKCMCEADMEKYVDTMAPYTVQVGLENKSTVRLTVKLEVSWISRYRKMGRKFDIDPRSITLEPRSSHMETIWANNYYDLIKLPDGITAKVSVVSKRYMDINLRNNTKNINQCYYYMY